MLRTHVVKAALVGVLAGLGAAGCTSGEHSTSFSFLVAPLTDGTFGGWTDIKLGIDISSVGTTNLWGATLGMQQPAPVPDLTFLSSLVGKADETMTTVVNQDVFPTGQPTVDLNIDYLGDLHPLFTTDNEIRIDWSGALNPAFKDWPTGGIWMQGELVVNVQ